MRITDEYRRLNRVLHEQRKGYGTGGAFWAGIVWTFALAVGGRSCLDYGAGKRLLENSGLSRHMSVRSYDPCVPEISADPEPADVVVCTDVLEHVEPDCLIDVLEELNRLAIKGLFLSIATVPSDKLLADGRNNHLIVQPFEWWLKRFPKNWRFVKIAQDNEKFWGTVTK